MLDGRVSRPSNVDDKRMTNFILPANPQTEPGESISWASPGEISGVEAQVAPFPLTPALSPGERGKDFPRYDNAVRVGFSIAQPPLPPLLGYPRPSDGRGAGGEGNGSGEGRGEGERGHLRFQA